MLFIEPARHTRQKRENYFCQGRIKFESLVHHRERARSRAYQLRCNVKRQQSLHPFATVCMLYTIAGSFNSEHWTNSTGERERKSGCMLFDIHCIRWYTHITHLPTLYNLKNKWAHTELKQKKTPPNTAKITLMCKIIRMEEKAATREKQKQLNWNWCV